MADGQAIVNPAEVRRFANRLRQFTRRLNDESQTLHAQLRELGETWRDSQHRKFQEEFTTTADSLRRFAKDADQYAVHLDTKAGIIEKYLQQGR